MNISNRSVKMENTNIKVEFRILGDDFPPEIITEKLSIKPNEVWIKGDKIKNKDFHRKYSCWILSTGYEESLDINNQLKKIYNIIKIKKNKLRQLKKTYELDYQFDIIINIEKKEKPAIYLDLDIIKFANDIEAEFDFDLYIF